MYDFMNTAKSLVEMAVAGSITGIFASMITLVRFDTFQDKKFHKLCSEHKDLGEKIEEMRETLSKEHEELRREHGVISAAIGTFQMEWRTRHQLIHEQKDISNAVKQIITMEVEMRRLAEAERFTREKITELEKQVMELLLEKKEQK